MKFDLIRPCDNCPFSTSPNRINFRNRERAQEIAELAYRSGFVCHEHGEDVEEEESSYIDFRLDGSSQHCFGALYMHLREGSGTVPWEHAVEEDPSLEERWWDRLPPGSEDGVFENEEAFLVANAL